MFGFRNRLVIRNSNIMEYILFSIVNYFILYSFTWARTNYIILTIVRDKHTNKYNKIIILKIYIIHECNYGFRVLKYY